MNLGRVPAGPVHWASAMPIKLGPLPVAVSPDGAAALRIAHRCWPSRSIAAIENSGQRLLPGAAAQLSAPS